MNGNRESGIQKLIDTLQAVPLLTFYEFSMEHARHLRTTNPIESVFATIRLRTKPMKRFRTISSGVHLVFKLMERAKTAWRGIGNPEKLKEVKLPN